jgi:hypothetical protein
MSQILMRSFNASQSFSTQRTRRRSSLRAAEVSWQDTRLVPQKRSSNQKMVLLKRVMALPVQSLLPRIVMMETKTKIRSQHLQTSCPHSLSRREDFRNQSQPPNRSLVLEERSHAGQEERGVMAMLMLTAPLVQMWDYKTDQILCNSNMDLLPMVAPTRPSLLLPSVCLHRFSSPLPTLLCLLFLPSSCPSLPCSLHIPPLLLSLYSVAVITVCVGIIMTLLAALLYTQQRGVYSEDDMPTVKGYWRAPSIQASLYDDSTHSEGAVVYGEGGGLEMETTSSKITSSSFRPDCPSEVRI